MEKITVVQELESQIEKEELINEELHEEISSIGDENLDMKNVIEVLKEEVKALIEQNGEQNKTILDLSNENQELLEKLTDIQGFLNKEGFSFRVDLDEGIFQIKMDNHLYTNHICDLEELIIVQWMILDNTLPTPHFAKIVSTVNQLETSSGMATVKFGVSINEDMDKIMIYFYEC